jgi:hypothetical protein
MRTLCDCVQEYGGSAAVAIDAAPTLHTLRRGLLGNLSKVQAGASRDDRTGWPPLSHRAIFAPSDAFHHHTLYRQAFPCLLSILHHFQMRSIGQAVARAAPAGRRFMSAGFSLALSEDQRAFQELARNFAKTEIIPVAAALDLSSKSGRELVLKYADVCGGRPVNHTSALLLPLPAVEYPHAVFKKAWEAGLCNLAIPQSCGGAGLHGEPGVSRSTSTTPKFSFPRPVQRSTLSLSPRSSRTDAPASARQSRQMASRPRRSLSRETPSSRRSTSDASLRRPSKLRTA